METFISVIKHTPFWGWALFVFLIYRGIAGLKDREMTLRDLFALPLIFFIWGVYSTAYHAMYVYIALAAMGVFLLIGTTLGWGLWKSKQKLYTVRNGDLIVRPGSPFILCLSLFIFAAKFSLITSRIVHPELYTSIRYSVLLGVISGFFSGLFWGRTLNLFIPWCKSLEAEK